MARGIEIHLTPEVGSMLQDDMQIATNGADEGMARNANHRSQDKKNHSAKRRRLKRRLQPTEEAHKSLVHVLDLDLNPRSSEPGGNATVENTRQREQSTIQSSEAMTARIPRTPLNSPKAMLPAIEFSRHGATATPNHNAYAPIFSPGFHFDTHAPQHLLQPEPRQGDVPAAQFFGDYPSIRRSQCPNCGHVMQEWCANVSNGSSGPLYKGIPGASNKTFHAM